MPSYVDTGSHVSNLPLLKSEWSELTQIRSNSIVVHDLADGDQLKYRARFMSETPENLRKRPKFAAQLYGRAVDLAASTYYRSVLRSAGDPVQNDLWSRLLWNKGRVALAETDRNSIIGGNSLIVVKPIIVNSQLTSFKLFSIPSYRWVALSDREDPGQVAAVLVLWRENDRKVYQKNGIMASTESEWLYLDSKMMVTTSKSGEVVQEHGLGIAPFVVCPNTLSTIDWSGTPMGGWDNANTVVTLNMSVEMLLWVSLLSRGQLAVYGDSSKVRDMGPISPMELDADSRAEFLSQNANLQGISQTLQMVINLMTVAWSLPPNFFNVVSIQPPSSAAVLQVSTAQLEEFLSRRHLVTSEWENRLHTVCATIATSLGITLSSLVEISYPIAPQILTPSEQLASIGFQLDHHLMSTKNAAIALNPDKSIPLTLGSVEAAKAEAEAAMQLLAKVAGHA